MAWINDGLIGANLSASSASALFAVGTVRCGSDNSKWVYVQADASCAQYAALSLNQSGKAVPLTTTNSSSSKKVAFAQVAMVSGSYYWAAEEGQDIKVNLAANCADYVQLYTTSTNGVLDDAIVSGSEIQGVVAITSVSNATAATIIAKNVHIGGSNFT